MSRVCVVGCGVIGLSTAIVVQQSLNAHVTIIADKWSPHTTSDGAAGLVECMLDNNTPQDHKQRDWILRTEKYLESLVRSEDTGAACVQILSGYYLSKHNTQIGNLSQYVNGFRKLSIKEMAAYFPNYNNGWFVTMLQLECHKYLPWLMNKFQEHGGIFINRHINSLSEIAGEYDVVVNCTGLGARELGNDPSVYPIRGQVIRVKAPWVKHFIIDIDVEDISKDNYTLYIIPCVDTVVVGGTLQKNNWNLEVDAVNRKDIWTNCSRMLPSITMAEVDHEWVGLRPGRPTVRLERETKTIGHKTIQVVHNYGHGGRGVSMHWGCANDAANLVKDAINDNTKKNILKSKI
ncbi:D-aspartate oxidase-like [Anneissia japonica]|uniref:D-aspartate oxidase-like n=1 Tax=Anneissia japonica TaxID=1529436 RepID=UPI001425AB9C|nr:D-aspartate oxidase-like [Anneissia japonica]XP_033126988.1 D-aspartate oxidase-like [Anneissia japonica]XP_033126989.1 D-aspartate oxidase-like [Anneissia japonica]XP_033126990.1 D-aspartate oxidase-like [Anneissia japonica]XP_033126991.1 D-aspartate oxidase-like [Anneissia japonica]XP_033126993.1 D-aspartate oxidase-like [Anneissia japonica]XP_033126994.1 D-aspartate oxidase-like [Anneissia japonica]XP_033126995.1 D-aspartate oxidase-like [Anneissia japonica]